MRKGRIRRCEYGTGNWELNAHPFSRKKSSFYTMEKVARVAFGEATYEASCLTAVTAITNNVKLSRKQMVEVRDHTTLRRLC